MFSSIPSVLIHGEEKKEKTREKKPEAFLIVTPSVGDLFLCTSPSHGLSLTDRFGLHTFTYDALNRLNLADHPLASSLADEAFSYDPVGNRTSSHLSLSHVYDAANRLLEDDQFTYTYDVNGNLTSKTTKALPAQTTTYTYDVENQLVSTKRWRRSSS